MERRFLSNVAFSVFINLLIKPIWILGIDREVQNNVGASEYGIYYALFNFSFLFQILLDLGLQYVNSREVASSPEKLKTLLPAILLLKLVLAAIYLLFSFFIAFLLGYDREMMSLLPWLLGIQILISYLLYMRTNIAALHYFKWDAFFSVLDKILIIPLLGYYLHFRKGPFYIEHFIYAQFFCFLASCCLCTVYVFFRIHIPRLTINKTEMLGLLGRSLPFAGLILIMSLFNKADTVMIERLLADGKEEAGIYAASMRLVDAFNMFGLLMASILIPMFSRQISEGKNISALANESLLLLLGVLIPLCCSCFFHAEYLMQLLYVNADFYYSSIFSVLIWMTIPIGVGYVSGSLLTAGAYMKRLSLLFIFLLFASIGLNLIIIPQYAAFGVAVLALLLQLIAAGGQLYLCHRQLQYIPSKGLLKKGLILFLLSLGSDFLLLSIMPASFSLFLIMLLVGLIFSFSLGMIDYTMFLFRLSPRK